MRQSTKGMWIAASLALLAGCATVQVSGPTGGTPSAAAASASTHWRFDAARPAAPAAPSTVCPHTSAPVRT